MENKPTIREEFNAEYDRRYFDGDVMTKDECADFFLNKIKEVVGSEELCTCSDLPQIPHRHQSNEKINQERQRILKEFGIIK